MLRRPEGGTARACTSSNKTHQQSARSAGRVKKSDIVKKRSQFSRNILAVRKRKSTPKWVQGARPSDECIAMHNKDDPCDKTPCPPRSKKAWLSGRVPSADDMLYELPAGFRIQPVDAGGVPCIWTNWPGTCAESGVIMYFHGGAMVTGHPDVNWCARLSCLTGMRVLTVDYRLAPEHPMPASTEDCLQAYQWLIQTTPPEQVALYGRSAGATLVMTVLQGLMQQNLPLPACGVPVSAWAPHMTQFELWQKVVGNEDWSGKSSGVTVKSWQHILSDPRFNFMAGQLKGLPPLYVGVGSLENVDRDLQVSRLLAKAAQTAGVHVQLDVARNLQHCPDNNIFLVPEDTAFAARATVFIHQCLGKAGMKQV